MNSTAFGMGLYDVGKIFYGPEQRKIQKKFEEIDRAMAFGIKKFCLTRSGIRSYKELCLKEVWGAGVIPEIILGPMCIQKRIKAFYQIKWT
ncbi:MAG: hypothetical protein ACLR0U_26010 [Enterocloster clostridioformis]